MENKYTLIKQDGGNDKVLAKNGNFVLCPFLPPFNVVITQSPINQGQSLRMSNCGTFCPHASLDNDVYSITCGCERVSFKIDNPKEETKTSSIITN